MRFFFSLILIFLFSGMLEAVPISWSISGPEGISVETHFSSSELLLSDTLTVDLKLIYPLTYQIDPAQLEKALLHHSLLQIAPFELVNSTREDKKDAVQQTELHYELRPQLEGSFPLTFMAISFLPQQAEAAPVELISPIVTMQVTMIPQTLSSPLVPSAVLPLSQTLPIEINTDNAAHLLADDQEASRNVKLMQERMFPWLEVIVVAVLALFLLALRYAPIQNFIPKESSEAKELRLRRETTSQILSLQEGGIPTTELYGRLSDILRQFFEERFQLEATTQTTPEFLKDLIADPRFSTETKTLLAEILVEGDLAKFALQSSSQDDFKRVQQGALVWLGDK
ncbi:MAG: hypothetical protein H0X51_07765 [Parachlamydiaceae bacterium]|nr:hypothetical protein [Parachlamydiaceae bacterium]